MLRGLRKKEEEQGGRGKKEWGYRKFRKGGKRGTKWSGVQKGWGKKSGGTES